MNLNWTRNAYIILNYQKFEKNRKHLQKFDYHVDGFWGLGAGGTRMVWVSCEIHKSDFWIPKKEGILGADPKPAEGAVWEEACRQQFKTQIFFPHTRLSNNVARFLRTYRFKVKWVWTFPVPPQVPLTHLTVKTTHSTMEQRFHSHESVRRTGGWQFFSSSCTDGRWMLSCLQRFNRL